MSPFPWFRKKAAPGFEYGHGDPVWYLMAYDAYRQVIIDVTPSGYVTGWDTGATTNFIPFAKAADSLAPRRPEGPLAAGDFDVGDPVWRMEPYTAPARGVVVDLCGQHYLVADADRPDALRVHRCARHELTLRTE